MRLLIVWALAVLAVPAAAQEDPSGTRRDRGWFVVGLGAARPQGLALSAVGSFGRERILQAGGRTIISLDLLEDDVHNAVHVGAGLSRPTSWGRVSVAAGPAVVWGHRRRPDLDESFAGPGLALDAQTTLAMIPQMGLGLGAFAVLAGGGASVAGVSLLLVFEGKR